MATQQTDSTSPKGTFVPPTASDVRGPCPMLNTLANHGYLPHDGRAVQACDITTALRNVIGISWLVTAIFTYPIFLTPNKSPAPGPDSSLWSKTRYHLLHPLSLLHRFGMRRPGQTHPLTGKPCLDLDQLGSPHAIEHDVSLTRHDRAEGDCCTPQPDLVAELLTFSSDGGETLTVADLAAYRRRRIQDQKEANPRADYGAMQHSFACMEIALLVGVLGQGEGEGRRVRCDFARAFLLEERLPYCEGWVIRRSKWRTLGFLELGLLASRVRKLVGRV